MTIDEAKQKRNEYKSIIGKTSPIGLEIVDVIVEPLNIGKSFMDKYFHLMRYSHPVDNDKLLEGFKSDSYKAAVVLDTDGDMESFMLDDIELYSSLI